MQEVKRIEVLDSWCISGLRWCSV